MQIWPPRTRAASLSAPVHRTSRRAASGCSELSDSTRGRARRAGADAVRTRPAGSGRCRPPAAVARRDPGSGRRGTAGFTRHPAPDSASTVAPPSASAESSQGDRLGRAVVRLRRPVPDHASGARRRSGQSGGQSFAVVDRAAGAGHADTVALDRPVETSIVRSRSGSITSMGSTIRTSGSVPRRLATEVSDPERVEGRVAGISDRDVFAFHEGMGTQAVSGLVVRLGAIVVVDQPRRRRLRRRPGERAGRADRARRSRTGARGIGRGPAASVSRRGGRPAAAGP